jgi:hypothetical protein
MTPERHPSHDPRIEAAIAELTDLVRSRYPTATFEVTDEEDPEGTYLTATVDVDDTDEVIDLVINRLLELEIDEGLPVYFVPVRPLHRVAETQRQTGRVQRGPALGRYLQP